MKKVEQAEKIVCDICERESAWNNCLGCGKDICHECRRTGRAKEYAHAVFFSGSEDGTYCLECDQRLAKTGDQLHAAYRSVLALRNEYKGWEEDFRKRSDTAQERVKALRPTRS